MQISTQINLNMITAQCEYTILAKKRLKTKSAHEYLWLLYLEVLLDTMGCYWLWNDNHISFDVEPNQNLGIWFKQAVVIQFSII